MLATIDFEMTALSYNADMIEAGVALWCPGQEILVWSSLIRPRNGPWDEASAAIHKITREELKSAPPPREVALILAGLLADAEIAYCDGLPHDLIWMRMLYLSANARATFNLAPIAWMPGLDDAVRASRMCEILKSTPAPHRAGPDAARLMLAYAQTIEENPEVTVL